MMHGPKYQLQNISELCRNNSNDEPEVSLDGRVDRFGNPINKQLKFHISFRDEISPQLHLQDIYMVENWKLYNMIDDREETDACCKQFCQII